MMRYAVVLMVTATLALTAAALRGGPVPIALADKPVITYMFPGDGDVLTEKPAVIQMCFARPVNNRDKDKGGDFEFRLVPPDKSGVGMRIVFQPDGYGLAIYPNLADKPDVGQWTFTYRVTDYTVTDDATEGQITFTVKPGGSPVIKQTPPPCTGDMTPGPTLIPAGTGTTAAASSPSPAPAGGSGGGSDVLELALLTLAAAGGATLVGFIGYAVRNKVGFWLHRPPERGEGPDDDHPH